MLYFFLFSVFFLMIRRPPRSTLFPTRRSSDLIATPSVGASVAQKTCRAAPHAPSGTDQIAGPSVATPTDRKSTRLNSSHTVISYAVFCLKKKKKKKKSNKK